MLAQEETDCVHRSPRLMNAAAAAAAATTCTCTQTPLCMGHVLSAWPEVKLNTCEEARNGLLAKYQIPEHKN